MLSRTASNLYWLARYMERAEATARLLEVGGRMALMPKAGTGYRTEWESILQASGTAIGFRQKYGEGPPRQRDLESHMIFDRDNPSSIASCIENARENGRIVRTALTSEVWDTLNVSLDELRMLERVPRSSLVLTDVTEWTIRRAAMLRGSMGATLLRNDGFDFLNIGYYLERADTTARLLDVKYYVLLPKVDYVGSGLDTLQWTMLLRALSTKRSYHWAYGGDISPAKIADFLILNRQCPRALITSTEGALEHLERLGRGYGRTTSAQTEARNLMAEIAEMTVDDIFEEGLHEYLTGFIGAVAGLGNTVAAVYLSGEMQ